MNSNRSGNPSFGGASTSPFVSSGVRPPPQASSSQAIPVDTLISVLQRLVIKLDALDQRAVPPRLPPQPDPDPNYGMQWEWQPPSWAPEGLLTASTAVTIPSQPFASANGWQQADFLHRGAATQHTSSVSRPPDVYPSTSWDSPFQPHMSLGPQPHDGPPPTSWDRPTTRVGEFHAPRSYWEPSSAFFQQRHLEFAGEGQHGDSFGPSMKSMTSTIPSSWDPPTHRMNYFHHDQRSEWEQSAPRGNPATYRFDPRFGEPRTSWDLPGPCIAPKLCSDRSDWNHSESYGGGGSSQYEYGASRNHGGGSYSPYSNYGGGYSGGSYANEPNPYESPPPPPRDGYYVPAPQPKPPSYAPPQQPWVSPSSLTTLNDAQYTAPVEGEREGRVAEIADEEEVNRVVCVESEAEVVDGIAAPANRKGDKLVTEEGLDMKTEEEFVSVVDVTLEAGETHAYSHPCSEIRFGVEARTSMLRGVEELADAINVVMEQSYGAPKVAKATSISLHASRLPSIGLVERIELEISKERVWSKMILEVTSPSNGSVKVLKFIFGLYDLAEVYKEFVSPP